MKNKIFTLSIAIASALSFTSYTSFAQSNRAAEKTTCMCTPPPYILIPYAGGTRLGWVHAMLTPDGIPPSIIPDWSIVANQTGGVNTWRIRNSSLVGGLPADFPGLSATTPLTGVAICRTCTALDENVYVCGTMSVSGTWSHKVLIANRAPAAPDYEVYEAHTISALFAPAAAGWKLIEIETNGPNIYGLFSKPGGTSILASITLTGTSGGAATAIWNVPFLCSAMDINNAGTHAYLLDNGSSSFTRVNLTGTPLPTGTYAGMPITSTTGGLGLFDYWLNVDNMTASMIDFYTDSPAGTWWATTGGVSTLNSTTFYILNNWSSTGMFSNPCGGIFLSDDAPHY